MAAIRGCCELHVYQLSREEARRIFATTRRFPKEDRGSLTDPTRRSSRAVNAMVVEARARRSYRAAFVNRIGEALGEPMETRACPDHALACECVSKAELRRPDGCWQSIGAMLRRMTERADTCCTPNQG